MKETKTFIQWLQHIKIKKTCYDLYNNPIILQHQQLQMANRQYLNKICDDGSRAKKD